MKYITEEKLKEKLKELKAKHPNAFESATAIQNWSGWMDGWRCSRCDGAMIGNKPNYCPNCGRKFTSYQLKDEETERREEDDE